MGNPTIGIIIHRLSPFGKTQATQFCWQGLEGKGNSEKESALGVKKTSAFSMKREMREEAEKLAL